MTARKHVDSELRDAPVTTNLLANLANNLDEEVFETLLEGGRFRVERIVSHGQASPADFWYDQDNAEWVVLLSGAARLVFADEPQPLELRPGDAVNIAAHRRHRVEWTAPDEPTVWLAIHYRE
ncbi:MAG: cupin domain-containing protein [Pirellulales bacterium]